LRLKQEEFEDENDFAKIVFHPQTPNRFAAGEAYCFLETFATRIYEPLSNNIS
jgi:hypothetical protein